MTQPSFKLVIHKKIRNDIVVMFKTFISSGKFNFSPITTQTKIGFDAIVDNFCKKSFTAGVYIFIRTIVDVVSTPSDYKKLADFYGPEILYTLLKQYETGVFDQKFITAPLEIIDVYSHLLECSNILNFFEKCDTILFNMYKIGIKYMLSKFDAIVLVKFASVVNISIEINTKQDELIDKLMLVFFNKK